jgi:hypothetical protein
MLCFYGGGVGHKPTHVAIDCFKKDHDCLDIRTRPDNNSESEELNESDSDTNDSEMLSDDCDEVLNEEKEEFGIKGLK